MKMDSKTLEDKVEELLDQTYLTELLGALVNVCHGKAEHLQSNWQDKTAAKAWSKDAVTIDNIIRRINNL